MGRARYGDKFTVLPLGIDVETFHPRPGESTYAREGLHVVSAGRVAAHKRPEVFLTLASHFPDVQFSWYGDGDQRLELIAEAASRGLRNLAFPGACGPRELADAFRSADIFVLPSRAEGVPKVTQEAAACGLPAIVFGHYETPTVEHDRNGLVVWSDEELLTSIGRLLDDDALRRAMGREGAEMMRLLDWDAVAPRWEQSLREWLGLHKDARTANR